MSDRDSFASFVAARRGALLRTAYLLTGSREDAEDLVQTTLLKAVPRWGRICDHPEPYVRKILVREAVTRHRRRRWREIAVAEIPETGATEEDVSDREALRRALLTLAPRQRAVVVLLPRPDGAGGRGGDGDQRGHGEVADTRRPDPPAPARGRHRRLSGRRPLTDRASAASPRTPRRRSATGCSRRPP